MTTTVAEPVDTTGSAVRAQALGKRYRAKWALRDCSFELPAGKVAALVGANGAGKTTLMSVLAGLLPADEGSAGTSGRVAFVSQEKPVYRHFTAAEMLRLGARLNVVWDADRAERWLERFEVPLDRACGKLSGGQQAQVAFALAVGARPDVLMLDEPLANLDPLARREVTAELLAEVAETGMTVLLSTHVVAELGGVADHLLLLAHGRLLAGGDLDELLTRHVSYAGPASETPPVLGKVVEARHRGTQSTFLVELPEGRPRPVVAGPWVQRPVTLEDYVLAQLAATRKGLDA
ncbi:ABC transporter ATP-binding protein [Actinosynnema sp. NPDC047251]|uniref:ABC-type transporter n=1 Tax=Saccharothrix espanaensis (strain ATCC 51144 / DSM 44229 / JCM 9112 / NBRC 15066 / NRRL 15764) TaxID=1179773 RepID=K0KDK0_SACES|nr:ABC transporter ATP-binding protein [Saccharothrix espanaensis]CCH34874.1 ABC-type transporter [Saccharothrix espanaensis DSM 44229]